MLNMAICNIHTVCEYTHLSFNQALELPCDLFQSVLKNAYVERKLETSEGRKELEDYVRLNTKTPDITGLEKLFGKIEINNEVIENA